MNDIAFTGNQAVPFRTQDAILAFSLYAAGVPEWCPPTNTYDADILGKARRYRGLELEEAAKQAFKNELRGRVDYWFERTPGIDSFLKAYSDQQEKIAGQKGEDGKDVEVGQALHGIISDGAIDGREALLRLSCVILKTRLGFVNRWKEPSSARLSIPLPGASKEIAPNTTSQPGMKSIPLFASDDTKRKLKLI